MESFNRWPADAGKGFNVGQGNTPCRAASEHEPPPGQVGSGAAIRGGETPAEADPDFSEEFGFARGFAGGEGFENVEFERWV